MKAIKKPIPIDVEEFQPEKTPWPRQVSYDTVLDSYYVKNELHDAHIRIWPGDYVNVTDTTGADIYPIDRATFERTYDVVK